MTKHRIHKTNAIGGIASSIAIWSSHPVIAVYTAQFIDGKILTDGFYSFDAENIDGWDLANVC